MSKCQLCNGSGKQVEIVEGIETDVDCYLCAGSGQCFDPDDPGSERDIKED